MKSPFRQFLLLRRAEILIGLAALVAVIALLEVTAFPFGWEYVDKLFGFGTLIIAVAIWAGESRKLMRAGWPKRLTARFLHPADSKHAGRAAYECRMAYLAGQSDIRAWGQQIGRQMAGSPERPGDLKFALIWDYSNGKLKDDWCLPPGDGGGGENGERAVPVAPGPSERSPS